MRLRDVLSSQSAMDIVYSCRDRGDPVKKGTKHPLTVNRNRRYAPIDRSQQGAALSGYFDKPVDTRTDSLVRSTEPAAVPLPVIPAPMAQKAASSMTVTLKGLNKRKTVALYGGTPGVIRISLGAFPGKTAPEAMLVTAPDGSEVFAVKAAKTPKVKLTKEERAALPKLTEAEKIARMEDKLAKAKAKLEAKAASL